MPSAFQRAICDGEMLDERRFFELDLPAVFEICHVYTGSLGHVQVTRRRKLPVGLPDPEESP